MTISSISLEEPPLALALTTTRNDDLMSRVSCKYLHYNYLLTSEKNAPIRVARICSWMLDAK